MYQPKIRDDLIPRLYALAKAQGIPMTRLVNDMLTQGIETREREALGISDPPADDYQQTQMGKGKS